jgi:hypothetical protein
MYYPTQHFQPMQSTILPSYMYMDNQDGQNIHFNMVWLHHDHIGLSANTAHTDNDFSSLTFLIDNDCMGGSLHTTNVAHIHLHDPQFTDSVISATNDVPAQYVGSLPFAGRTYYAEMNYYRT